MNIFISSKEVDSAIRNLPTNKNPGPDGFTNELYQILKELMSVLFRLFQKIEEGTLRDSFYKANITLTPKPDKNVTRKQKF